MTIHYGSNSQSECGAADGLVSLKAGEVTCRTCLGWMPIVVAPEDRPLPKVFSAQQYEHAKLQAHADGYQTGWHSVLRRIREGDSVDKLATLAPKAATGERIRCSRCGKSVSTPVPAETVVRAWVECPECIEQTAGQP